MSSLPSIAVVIPCYKVKSSVLSIIDRIGEEVTSIFIVDDACPQGTGRHVEEQCKDNRVVVLYHDKNKGVGGAVITGYRKAIAESISIVVKIDGDGQMNPEDLSKFTLPILNGGADYTKGNRFFDIRFLADMPPIRILGNSILSFINKLSSGYWNIMDPTNGFTAVHTNILKHLPLDKIESRYFFESDMLFRLGTVRAVVQDIPLVSIYEGEQSGLNVLSVSVQFPKKYIIRIIKRIFYSYFLRDFNIGSAELIFGTILFWGGGGYGLINWYSGYISGLPTPMGIIMMAALPILLGFQLLLSALNYDITNTPDKPIHKFL